jgi:hypothetical protein
MAEARETANIGFLPWPSTDISMWPNTRVHNYLKIATLYYERLILPMLAEVEK